MLSNVILWKGFGGLTDPFCLMISLDRLHHHLVRNSPESNFSIATEMDWFTENSWPVTKSGTVKTVEKEKSDISDDWFLENSWPATKPVKGVKVKEEDADTLHGDWILENWPGNRGTQETTKAEDAPAGKRDDGPGMTKVEEKEEPSHLKRRSPTCCVIL